MQTQEKQSILVVDDEKVIRDLFERFLKKHGYSVTTAANGLDALEKIKENDYDMMILDLKMPVMDGMELLRKIGELGKKLITIIVTGHASEETIKETLKEGCFNYIAKPFDIEEVGIIIKKAFEANRPRRGKKRSQDKWENSIFD